jgi:methionyl-tRNA formyltransferase
MRSILITSGLNVVSKEIIKFEGIVGVVESMPLTNNDNKNSDLKNYLKKILKVVKHNSALKSLADKMGINFFSLDRKNSDLFFAWVKNLTPDLIIVYSMSQLIEPKVINLCKFGGINLHPSLLPDLKGPNPMQWAFLRNESNLGYTLHFVDAGEDSGPIIFQRSFEIPRGSQISDFEPYVALKYGFPLIKEAYFELVRNKYLASNPQPHKEKTFRAKRLTVFEIYNEIDWEDWQVERIWHCLKGIPEVSRLIPVRSRIIRKRNWKIGKYTRTSLIDDINLPYIKFDGSGFAIYTPHGRIEVKFKSKILQVCTQFVIKFWR